MSYLKSWEFYGRNKKGKWKLLHFEVNKPFSFAEERTFFITANESFNGFKILMTDANTYNDYALCLDQIEVFGDIYPTSYYLIPGKYRCTTKHSIYHPFSSLQIILICIT